MSPGWSFDYRWSGSGPITQTLESVSHRTATRIPPTFWIIIAVILFAIIFAFFGLIFLSVGIVLIIISIFVHIGLQWRGLLLLLGIALILITFWVL